MDADKTFIRLTSVTSSPTISYLKPKIRKYALRLISKWYRNNSIPRNIEQAMLFINTTNVNSTVLNVLKQEIVDDTSNFE